MKILHVSKDEFCDYICNDTYNYIEHQYVNT
jgi:hypothetical protein